jgi:hypothetical protein
LTIRPSLAPFGYKTVSLLWSSVGHIETKNLSLFLFVV